MTEVTVNIPPEYDKKVNLLRAERNISSKAKMIAQIVQEYFDKKDNKINLSE